MSRHKFSLKGIHKKEGIENDREGFVDVDEGIKNGAPAEEGKIDEYGMSLNALAETCAHNKIRIRELPRKRNHYLD